MLAPDFTPHRVAVKAADAAAPDANTKKAHGMVSHGYEEVAAAVKATGGTTSVTVEVLLWSDADDRFVKQQPAETFGPMTASRVIRFKPGGQRFFLHVTGTIDAAGQVDIACAGINPIAQSS